MDELIDTPNLGKDPVRKKDSPMSKVIYELDALRVENNLKIRDAAEFRDKIKALQAERKTLRTEVERLKKHIDSFNNAISIVEEYKPSEESDGSWSDGYITAKNDILEKLRETQN